MAMPPPLPDLPMPKRANPNCELLPGADASAGLRRAQLHAALTRPRLEDRRYRRRIQAGEEAGQERVVEPADQLRFLPRERMERAVAQRDAHRRDPVRFVAVPLQQPFAQGEGAFG